MSKPVLFFTVLVAACLPGRAAATPIFEERFNETGTVELVNGAELGPGLSNKPEDKAYSARAEAPDPAQPQPGAVVHDPAGLSGDLSQFTMTLWYKCNREIQDPDSLIHLGGFYLLWDKARGLTMRLGLPSGSGSFSNWFSAGIKGPVTPANAVDEWIFYAITWDYDAKACIIYQGTATAPVAVAGERHGFEVGGPVRGGLTKLIGNNMDGRTKSAGGRPFSGQIDNIRIYDKVLDQNAIEAIRSADTENTAPKLP